MTAQSNLKDHVNDELVMNYAIVPLTVTRKALSKFRLIKVGAWKMRSALAQMVIRWSIYGVSCAVNIRRRSTPRFKVKVK